MNPRFLAAALALALLSPPAPAAPAPGPPVTLRFHWVAGRTLTYLVQRDPYFADPARALEAADPDAPYQAPVVSLLTEEVLAVGGDGAATLRVTLAPAPGFEDEARPRPPRAETLTVSARGQVLGRSGGVSGGAEDWEMLSAFVRLPDGPVRAGAAWPAPSAGGPGGGRLALASVRGGVRGLAVLTRAAPPDVVEARSPDHDGTLLQTTRTARAGRVVFDLARGEVARETLTLTATVSLTMTGRGRRGVADFGRVVPNVQTVQTWTLERRDAGL